MRFTTGRPAGRHHHATRRSTRALAAFVALAMCGGSGCSYKLAAPPPKPDVTGSYRVGAPDELLVTILPDPRVEEKAVVRPDGMITIQLIGDVPAGGRTLDEISADIEQRISRFKRGAKVTIALTAARSTDVTVLGQIASPQAFPLTRETRAAEAIGMVGGPTIFASSRSIRVIRSGGGEAAVYKVNLNAIQGGDLSTNILLAPGDIMYVPPTFWARIGFAINAVLFPIQPLLGLATGVAANLATPGQ